MQEKGMQKVWNMMPKGSQNESQNPSKIAKISADPRSGVLEHLETGEVYLPLPPPPWGLRRQPLVPIVFKTNE